jgi:hypothetical protein
MVFGNDKVKRYFYFFTRIIFCNLNFSCAYYRWKSGQVGENKTERTIKRNDFGTNYYVIHLGDAMWEIRNFNMGSSMIKGELATFGDDQLAMYNRMISGQQRRVTYREP